VTFVVCSVNEQFFTNKSDKPVQVMLSFYNDLHHDMKVMLDGQYLATIGPENVKTFVLDVPSGSALTSDSPGKYDAIHFK